MTRAYYNEIDPVAAQWLRNLIAAQHIAPGDVDERSIEDVKPEDLHGYTQCHFFAGVGVWSYALRRANWPDDRPVWTGSCPCQPFSAAGKGASFNDERHLWPDFFHLIEKCRPAVIFGEQVASKDADPWIDLVQTDMEALGYAFGAVPFPSASVGAPHIRDRLYWVANAKLRRRKRLTQQHPSTILSPMDGAQSAWQPVSTHSASTVGRLANDNCSGCEQRCEGCAILGRWQTAQSDSGTKRLADTNGRDASAERQQRSREQRQQQEDGVAGGLADADGSKCEWRGACSEPSRRHGAPYGSNCLSRMGNAHHDGCATSKITGSNGSPVLNRESRANLSRQSTGAGRSQTVSEASTAIGSSPTNGFWRDVDWLSCRDGKWRPVEPGTFPLAHGATARMGRLRAYGNAINAEQATIFIQAAMSALT